MVLYGGAAGGGKTAALILAALRGLNYPGYKGVLYRREYVNLACPGGLVDETRELYPRIGGTYRTGDKRWVFPGGASISFFHCETETEAPRKLQGVQGSFIGVDEACTVSLATLMLLLSRIRGCGGLPAKLFMTANPDHAHPLAGWLKENGYVDRVGDPVPEMSGKVVWFLRRGDDIQFEPQRSLFLDEAPNATSFTFVPSRVDDNQILLSRNPHYKANLLAQSAYHQAIYYRGNWNTSPGGGGVFPADSFHTVSDRPATFDMMARGWDLASSRNRGDWTAGVLVGRSRGKYYILDCQRFREAPGERNRRMQEVQERDAFQWPGSRMVIEQQPGAGGHELASVHSDLFERFKPVFVPSLTSKVQRAEPLAEAMKAMNVFLLFGPWNEPWKSEMLSFGVKGANDDMVDATTLAFNFVKAVQSTGSEQMARSMGIRPVTPSMLRDVYHVWTP